MSARVLFCVCIDDFGYRIFHFIMDYDMHPICFWGWNLFDPDLALPDSYGPVHISFA
jgi:hypothetical protein